MEKTSTKKNRSIYYGKTLAYFMKNAGLLAKKKYLAGITFCLFLANINTINAQLLVPFSGSNSLACGTNTVLRDHANFTTYANNANGFTVLDAGLNAVINISGPYITESSFDFVRIYSGVGTGGPLLLSVSGTGNINFTGAAGQTLTVQFISDGSVVMQGFNLTISYTGACSNPCVGTPSANSIVTPTFEICPGSSTQIGLLNAYNQSGITYAWAASNTSPVGPFNVPVTATTAAFNSGPLTMPTWYQCVITCINGGSSITVNSNSVAIAAITTNTVPYFEGFEGVPNNGRLPNCSWAASGGTAICQTYTLANTLNRVPRTGSKFAAFSFNPSGTDYFYTNGIFLNAGVTYSAGLWYTTEATGFTNWTDLSILVGSAQTPAGLTSIVSTNGPAVSAIHKALGGTFTVSTSGLYYVAIKATRTAVGANFLSWDDLSVTIPCSLNTPPVTIASNNATVCSGSLLTLTGNGANNYSWTNGPSGPVYTLTPTSSGIYVVTGTSTLTSCSKTAAIQILVNPSPAVSIFANPDQLCSGDKTNLVALGANTYIWSNGNTGNIINVGPTANTIYSVSGTNQFNCSSTASVQVTVLPSPGITALASNTDICAGDALTLTGSGGVTYQWASNALFAQTNPVTITPNASAIYTCTGTGTNGCSAVALIQVAVKVCTGLNEQNDPNTVKVYPNPNNGDFYVETSTGNHTIQVIDVSGRIIISKLTSDGKTNISMSEFASGIYYIKVKSDNQVNVVKVIKE